MEETEKATEKDRDKTIEKRLEKRFRRALTTYQLIEDGDRVLVALSGGKDSLFLLEALAKRSRIFKPRFEVEAVHVRMRNISYESDCSYLQKFSESLGVKLHILETEFDPQTDRRKSPCFLCSLYRRKAIFELAQAIGFSSMPPTYKLDKMPLTIIRPLCLEQESDIAAHALASGYEKQKKLCPYEQLSHRTSTAGIFKLMESVSPETRYNIWHALEAQWAN